MQIARFLILALAAGAAARADFSYTDTIKTGTSALSGPTQQISQVFLKGRKMVTDTGNTAVLLDFEAQTITAIDRTAHTYSVRAFPQDGPEIHVDFKQTGRHKVINGFDAAQILMTAQVDTSQMELELWVSAGVPGARELHEFYQRNMSRFPWASVGMGGTPHMQRFMAEVQRRVADMPGVPVLEIMRVKTASASREQAEQMEKGMAHARQHLQVMARDGGPEGEAAREALARMDAMLGAGPLSETTIESSGFSTVPIPDSRFAIPPGFQKIGPQ